MKYANPVIPGFHPDPSCCRVGGDYYLVTSSFEYFPGVPIFHSRDLVHWRPIGHCLTRESQLPLAGAKCSGGIYAPTIRFHHGLFYMITTNTSHGGNFIVTTPDPSGEWSEPVWIDFPGIDPSLFFDGASPPQAGATARASNDGKVYCSGTGRGGGIWQFEIDVTNGAKFTEPRLVWPGTGGRYPEAPHLYKIRGVYYLMIAEGGTEYGHMETIARSASPWGPFEACPRSPILSHRDYFQSPIQATGHAELFEDASGNGWMALLGIRPKGGRFHHLGRETFLAPVTWDAEGWPVVGNTGRIEPEMEGPLPEGEGEHEVRPCRDDFETPDLRLCWNFLRNPRAGDWSLTERPGWLRLRGSAVTLSDLDSPAFVGRRQQHFNCRASCLVEFDPAKENDPPRPLGASEAGLTVLANATHHYEIAIRRGDGKRVIFVRRHIGDLTAVVAEETIRSGPVRLEIAADEAKYTFSAALGDGPARPLATAATRYVSTEVAGGFTGVYLGMYATGNGRPASVPADFDWFEYRPS